MKVKVERDNGLEVSGWMTRRGRAASATRRVRRRRRSWHTRQLRCAGRIPRFSSEDTTASVFTGLSGDAEVR